MLILTIIFALAIVAALATPFIADEPKFKKWFTIAAVMFVLMILTRCIVFIPANSVGIKYSIFTGTQETTLKEGVNFRFPLDKIYKISSEVQSVRIEEVTGQTKDSQWVTMALDIKYRVDPENAFTVFKSFRTLDRIQSEFVVPIAQTAINEVMTEFNVIDILGKSFKDLGERTEQSLEAEFAKAGINFYSITFSDIDAGEAIENAISVEAVAKKEVETAIQKKEKAKIEAETKKIEAENAAEIKVIAAKAEADSNRILAESLSEEILLKMEMEARLKWGWVTVNGAGSTIVQPGK